MHAGNDDDRIWIDPVVDAVRKSPKQSPSGVSMNYGVKLRIALNGRERAVYSLQKFCAEAWALLLVPKKRVVDIRRGCRTDKDLH